MKSTDKILAGIVAGIVLLIVAAFAATLTRPELTYQVEDIPEGVVHNYLLALRRRDYERAYAYLSPTLEGYPASAEKFTQDIERNSWHFRLSEDITLAVESASVTGDRAVVDVRETRFYGDSLFHSRQSSRVFKMDLQFEAGEWRIVDARSSYYFLQCWKQDEGCR